MPEEFVSEPIRSASRMMDPGGMMKGASGLPSRFIWRGKEYGLAEVLKAWKGSGRKQWFKVSTEDGLKWTIYSERQASSKPQNRTRWWLYTVSHGQSNQAL